MKPTGFTHVHSAFRSCKSHAHLPSSRERAPKAPPEHSQRGVDSWSQPQPQAGSFGVAPQLSPPSFRPALLSLLTSEAGPLSAPGQEKVTNSWHLLWTTKQQTATRKVRMQVNRGARGKGRSGLQSGLGIILGVPHVIPTRLLTTFSAPHILILHLMWICKAEVICFPVFLKK